MDSQQLRYVLINFINSPSAVCAIDQLKLLPVQTTAIICNNQTSRQPGMHWVSFYKPTASNYIEFFDSFGMPIKFYGPEFSQFIRDSGAGLRVSNLQYQSNVSDLCGAYCLYFLIYRSRGFSFDQIVEQFSVTNLINNDVLIYKFVSKNLHFPKFSKCGVTCLGNCLQNFGSVCVQINTKCVRQEQILPLH